jgi:ankyrin repeat protein
MEDGFLLACEYGRDAVIEELVASRVNLQARTRDGQTGLHMAAIGAQAGTVRLLLRLGLKADAVNAYGGTVLGQTRWSADHTGDSARYAGVIAVLEESK